MQDRIDFEYHEPVFKQINHWRDKVDYWNNDLKLDYFEFLTKFNESIELHPFKIYPELGEEKNYNKWVLENYPISQSKNNWPIKLIVLSELNEKLVKELSSHSDKKKILQDTLMKIDNSFQVSRFGIANYFNLEYSADYSTYQNQLKYASDPDYSKFFHGLSIISYENGNTLAKFRKYVEARLTDILDKKSPENKEESLTVDQIALLLYYSGAIVGMKNTAKTSIAKLFAPLLAVNFKNFYDALREIEGRNLKNSKNLYAIKAYLEKNKIKLGDAENHKFIADLEYVTKK